MMKATTVLFSCSTLVALVLLVGHVASQVTYIQPEKTIRCPAADEVCEVTLTVSNMVTLTAYSVLFGNRFLFGSPISINTEGEFELPNGPPPEPTTLFQPIAGDGFTRRTLYVINDQFPAPTIIGYTNQQVRIRVVNRLRKEAVTLHWHGMHLTGTPYMDGTPFITQCPIHPNNDFVYEFQLYPEGTFWYHAHFVTERSNGLYGALIVLPRDPPSTDYIDMPEAHTLLLNEWFTVNSEDWLLNPSLFSDPVNNTLPFTPVPISDGSEGGFAPFLGGLINGEGWLYTQDSASCRRLANTKLPQFDVSMGNRYRFRLIGSQSNYALRFSIQDHRFQVLASDGFDINIPNTMPQEVDFVIVNAGERYDIVVNASQPINNYAMIAETLEVPSVLASRGYCANAHRAYSVLHYEGASDSLPADFDTFDTSARCTESQCYAINCPFQNYPSDVNVTCINVDQLELSSPEPVPTNDVSETVFLHFGFVNGPSVNARIFSSPPSPILSQTGDIAQNRFCEYSQDSPRLGDPNCIHTYTITSEAVELVFLSQVDVAIPILSSAHPVHIHGHHFRVLHTGYPTYHSNGSIMEPNTDISCGGPAGSCDVGVTWTNGTPPPSQCEAADNCPIKDTVVVPSGGYVRVRFSRDNWGWWLLHCHIELHFNYGMSIILNATSAPGYVPPPGNFPQCGHFQSTSVSEPVVNTYQQATTGLAIVSATLLLALVVVSVVLLLVVLKKTPKKDNKDQVAMGTIPRKD